MHFCLNLISFESKNQYIMLHNACWLILLFHKFIAYDLSSDSLYHSNMYSMLFEFQQTTKYFKRSFKVLKTLILLTYRIQSFPYPRECWVGTTDCFAFFITFSSIFNCYPYWMFFSFICIKRRINLLPKQNTFKLI